MIRLGDFKENLMSEERYPGDGEYDVERRMAGKYYNSILKLRRAIKDTILAIKNGSIRDDEDVGKVYTQTFGEAFLKRLQQVLEETHPE